ncbi:hypothetical protein PVK06_004794 [Gossypium arboreum]|uniref:Uncharacterized protein n=1 Tax=Gossypium arboreum TaxID=29729 RepID=A0ABR0QU62_GOSAR|nr:hypothetical protein PVK06_004794 [Gossypium arboreum]
MLTPSAYSVRDLWMANGRCWNNDRVNLLYGKEWGDRICNLPIGNEDNKDCMVWFHNPHGYYSSKTTYSWLLLKELRCGANTETLLHALIDCTTFHKVLSMGGWYISRIMKKHDSCIDWIEDLMRTLDKKAMADLFTTLWNSDNAGLVNKINKGDMDITIIGARLQACKEAFNLFSSGNLVWSNRLCNNVANLICTKMCNEAKFWLFDMDYPKEIHNAVTSDDT